jgi:asparagine synthase (glutamine-hydrolysing)
MSAIFGILRFDGDGVSARDLERMGNTLAHRAPDGRKFVADGRIGLGHGLMRVNQEDSFEAQPIDDRAGDLILAADCRIDNREELAKAFGIGPAELRNIPDSALVLRAYKTWGDDCAAHLLGDFAFAIWDGRAGKLLLGRDHMGQRNLFYHKGQDFFAFATEIKALWAVAGVPRQLLPAQVARVFYRKGEYRPEAATLYAGIAAVPGGSGLVARRDGTFESRRYWQPQADPAHENRDESYYLEKYRRILSEAVACRLRRLTRPAALLNSAGFDTAAIAGLAGPVVTAQGRKLISLSWLGEETTKITRGDIRPWIDACRRVMPHLDIRELYRKSEQPFAGIERVFLACDGPGGSSRKTLFYLFAEAAAAGARLIMDGYGGDYTLNPRGRGALARHLRKGQLRRFCSELVARLRMREVSPWRVLKNEIVFALLPRSVTNWHRRVWRIGSPEMIRAAQREIEGPELKRLRKRNAAEANLHWETIPITALRARMMHNLSLICRGLTAGSTPAAAHGLDLTRPFHDKRVVELALAIPEDLYVKNGLNRYLARRALADIYPPEFQTRGRVNEGVLDDRAIRDMAAPELLAEAERLAGSEKLSPYFDFAWARRVLAEPDRAGRTASRKNIALRALLTARFIEWFSGPNA